MKLQNSGQIYINLKKSMIYSHFRRFSTAISKDIREGREVYKTAKINYDEPMFKKILIANRGEIACRIIKTARSMGIKTVAVHSDVDSGSLHARLADEAVCIGPAPAIDSYLRYDKIMEAAEKTGAEAVHPGYGFLSENTEFAAQLESNRIKFIGPNPMAILDMGDKIHSKKIAAAAKVNMIPGYDGEISDAEMCVKVANEIGYPVMIKASAGGGGKGMRVARNDEEARNGFRLSKQEAVSSFGDDRMLVEKFVDNPRHIEVQILCDQHGNAIYLNERECSVQRRNQKVIEEAPSSFVTPEMRAKMGEQAVQLAKAVGYDSAGTVEFLVDGNRNFYFLEMNTRLQVEHPITECITGVDIVQQMLRVAYGHRLTIEQKDVPLNGWAFECRVYAEDPYKGFGLPSVGRLSKYVEPRSIAGVRCDSGIVEGSDISIYYDPLICKLVTYGKTRDGALKTMSRALDNYVIRGVTHNIPLLRDIVGEQRFRDGNITTKYLPEVYPEGFQGAFLSPADRETLFALAAVIKAKKQIRTHLNGKSAEKPPVKFNYSMKLKNQENREMEEINVQLKKRTAIVTINGHKFEIDSNINLSDSVIKTKINNKPVTIQLVSQKCSQITLVHKGTPFQVDVLPYHSSELLKHIKPKPKVDHSSSIVSPMPGVIKVVNVKVGDLVSEGQELIVIEAMKMQNGLHAGKSGKVKSVNVKVAQTVDENDILVTLA